MDGPRVTTDEGAAATHPPTVKCVVWDLDNTVWSGVLAEDPNVELRLDVFDAILALDRRGILHSVASRNDPDLALRKLEELGVVEYFLDPQIDWTSKAASIRRISASLNVSLDSVAFVDDDPFERDEVAFELPEVLCIDAADAACVADLPRMMPRFVTEESRQRRQLYRRDRERQRAELAFVGSQDEFLAGLGMVLTIARASESDLQRAEELTVRTHQLNSTGVTYDYGELAQLCRSARHDLLIAVLEDRYGSYGTVGLSLVERDRSVWTVKLLLTSCRVISRGVGGIVLRHIMRRAQAAGVTLRAEFRPTPQNRIMLITYRFAGFTEVARDGDLVLLEAAADAGPMPPYVDVRVLG